MNQITLDPRIGPNIILQTFRALEERIGALETEQLASAAGLAAYFWHPPSSMTPEPAAVSLFEAVARHLDQDGAAAVAAHSGMLTADYVYKNRIPWIAKCVLRLLPRSLARRAMLMAITRNAWTFAGSAAFRVERVSPPALSLHHVVLPPLADVWYRSVFESLVQRCDPNFKLCRIVVEDNINGSGRTVRFF